MKAAETFYRTQIEGAILKSLHQRSDLLASLWVAGHVGSLFVTGALFVRLTESSLWVPAFLILLLHGCLFSFLGYAGASHELSHNTVFKRRMLNVVFLRLFSFLVWANHAYFSKTHPIHHRFTLEAGVDTEVPSVVCVGLSRLLGVSVFDLRRLGRTLRMQFLNAVGVVPGRAGSVVMPPGNTVARREVLVAAREILIGHFVLAVVFAASGKWQGILLVNLAAFIGSGLPNMLASVQHCGMKAGSRDYRENSRTVLLNPILQFFYWNMNYHVEHHMYPGVPCYNLPTLRRHLEFDLPPPTVGLVGVLNLLAEHSNSSRHVKCS